jgi:protein involved in polysaccharide export with SLBB domain
MKHHPTPKPALRPAVTLTLTLALAGVLACALPLRAQTGGAAAAPGAGVTTAAPGAGFGTAAPGAGFGAPTPFGSSGAPTPGVGFGAPVGAATGPALAPVAPAAPGAAGLLAPAAPAAGRPAAPTAAAPAAPGAPGRNAAAVAPSPATGATAPTGASAGLPGQPGPQGLPGQPAQPGQAGQPPQAGQANQQAQQSPQSQQAQDTRPAEDTAPRAEPVREPGADQTEFQRFVAQATGRSLPLFGYELFARGNFTASQGAAVPASYVLGPGDEVVVQVYGAVDITERLTIDREGRVLIPQAGPLTLSGVRLGEAEKVLTAHLRRIYRNFNLVVTMGRVRSTEVFVVGQARNPGKHVVSGLSTLINALFETGGPSANGSLRAVQLRRAGRTVATVDLYRFLAQGDSGGDEKLQPGDVIFIPPAGPRAAVLGTVNAPAVYELLPGETIAQVLALSGGLPVLAAPQKAQLERVNPARAVARYVEDFALDVAGLARPLQAGDVLTVFQISPQIADVVTLQGNVAAPMRYTHRRGMRVRDLVADNNFLVPVSYWLSVNAGSNITGLDRPEVNLDYATIQRLDPERLRTTLIPFHLAKALRGDPAENLALLPGDIVRIYGPEDPGPPALDSVAVNAPFIGGERRFAWRPNARVSSVIPSADWLRAEVLRWVRRTGGAPATGPLTDHINVQYAVIKRVDSATLRTETIAFHLARALHGDEQHNLLLQPGDQISLYAARQPGAEAQNSISVNAALLGGTQRHAWRPGMAVRDAIPSAEWLREQVARTVRATGGALGSTYASDEINLDYATIRRLDAQNLRSELIAFNLGRALQGDPQDNLALQPGDQIAVYGPREPLPETLNSISLRGEAIGTERRFVWRPGFAIRDIIPTAEWLVTRYNYWQREIGKELRNDLNWDYAQVIRRVPDTLQTQALNFNLGGAVLQGRAEDNLPLQPGDRIALYTTQQMPVPASKRVRMVTLAGEVRVPGVYQAAPGETLAQLVQRAGGFTPQAYAFGTDFRRESTRAGQQQNLERLVQRLELQAQSDAQTRLQNVSTPEQQLAAQTGLQADRMRLATLRSLRATGRISLRLEPDRPVQLPDIALEDGDIITVPERPSFVAAFGAVNNENVILWRQGMTVNELLNLAGPTAVAELENTHVLRADGTVLSADTAGGGFLSRPADIRHVRLMPGDTVVVPEKADRETAYTRFIRGAKDITTIFYQFGLGSAALKTLRN